MWAWFKKRKINNIINEYGNEYEVKNLILKIFDFDNYSSEYGEYRFEDEYLKVFYSKIWSSEYSNHTYIVSFKTLNETWEEVFHRTKRDTDVKIDKFKIGYWVYHLYKIANKELNMSEIGIDKFKAPDVEEEQKILSTIK